MSNMENIQEDPVNYNVFQPGTSSTSSLLALNNSGRSLPPMSPLLDFSSSSLNSMRGPGQEKMSEAEFDYKKEQLADKVKSMMSAEISGSGRFLTRLRNEPPAANVPVRLHVSNLPFRFR